MKYNILKWKNEFKLKVKSKKISKYHLLIKHNLMGTIDLKIIDLKTFSCLLQKSYFSYFSFKQNDHQIFEQTLKLSAKKINKLEKNTLND